MLKRRKTEKKMAAPHPQDGHGHHKRAALAASKSVAQIKYDQKRFEHLLGQEDREGHVAPATRKLLRQRSSFFTDAHDPATGFPIYLPPGQIRSGRTVRGKMGYLVRLPADFDPAKKYPLLVYFHGGATFAAADAPFPEKIRQEGHEPDDPWNLLDHDILAFEKGCIFPLVAQGVHGVPSPEDLAAQESGGKTSLEERMEVHRQHSREAEKDALPLSGDCVMLAPHVNKGHLDDDNGWWQWTYPDALENTMDMMDLLLNQGVSVKLEPPAYDGSSDGANSHKIQLDPQRIYLTGKSAGGTGCISTALAINGYDFFRWPNRHDFKALCKDWKVAGIAAVCPKVGRNNPHHPHEGDDYGLYDKLGVPHPTPAQQELEHWLMTPYYPSPQPHAEDDANKAGGDRKNVDCHLTAHIVHDDHTNDVLVPESAGGKYVSDDATRRIQGLLRLQIPIWIFVAEEDKWHAEVYADHFFETCKAALVDKKVDPSVDAFKPSTAADDILSQKYFCATIADFSGKPGAKRVQDICLASTGETRVRYTKYYKECEYGHASWVAAYQDPHFCKWFTAHDSARSAQL
ncbi:unnamed protein product [Amoebophrya sp. A25]|nr:unnamed protein product [Amoebophrya sp. A25]|eukprot:GSA25T00011292001.1